MQNVYDELFGKELIHIVSNVQSSFEVRGSIYKDTAIAVNLYYEDTLQQYFTYLDNVPSGIEVFIYSSNEKAWDAISCYAAGHSNMFFSKKVNRGRDISAFLVSFKQVALRKKFVCFLHDKREKSVHFKEDTDYWIENLWSNTICSDQYIKNVLGMLDGTGIGILAPPIPFGEKLSYWYANQWSDEDFELACTLADKLGLTCKIDKRKMPITLGSVFWCKTEAVRKLLDYDWKYEDFQDEPMSSDGTISHAIERIFAYVAQDAGYTTEWIMCPKYAGSLVLKSQSQLTEIFRILKKNFIAENMEDLRRYHRQKGVIENFCSKCRKIYLYGAGVEGRKFANWMYIWELSIDGFIVTKLGAGQKTVLDIPVYEFDKIEIDKMDGIIITVGSKLCQEIEAIVRKRGDFRYYTPTEEGQSNI